MSSNQELVDLARKVLVASYKQPPFVLTRGERCRVWDADGHEYLDLCAGIAVVSCGHGHPELARAIGEQAARLMHTSNLFYNDRAIELADELVRRTGFARVFFCNSGTEANEGMLKIARRWHHEHGRSERTEIVATVHSFHGRSMGALSMTGQPKYHVGLGPLVGDVKHVTYGDLDAMRAAVGPRTAAIIVEPIQAEGGIVNGTDAYLRGLRALADDVGALLLFDEVQTCHGRTGTFLAREPSGVRPDVCALAKGIAGGFPYGAMLVTEKMADGLPPGSHGTTFGGNPLGAAAALAVLRIFDAEGLVDNARRVGEHLGTRIAALVADGKHPAAKEARGRGLLRGIALADGFDPAAVLAKVRDRRVLMSLAGGNVLRFTPPLCVTADEIDEGFAVVADVLRDAPRVAKP